MELGERRVLRLYFLLTHFSSWKGGTFRTTPLVGGADCARHLVPHWKTIELREITSWGHCGQPAERGILLETCTSNQMSLYLLINE